MNKALKILVGRFARLRNASRVPFESGVFSVAITKNAEAIQSLCYAGLKYPSKKQFVIFRTYIRMINIAYHLGCKNVLVIDAGLSTAVWACFAQRTKAKVCTIDADFGSMKSFLGNSDHAALITENVELVEGTIITADELVDFYTNGPKETFGGVEVPAFVDNLDFFKDMNRTTPKCQEVAALALRGEWSIRDLIISGSALIFLRQLVNIFSSDKTFDNEVALLKSVESRGKAGVLDNLIVRGNEWDLVFFDSVELSSMVEWGKLKDKIAVCGIVAFHDIFSPKCFKNFIVCASILADPDWKAVFVDDSTKQGLMIAQRLL